MRCAFLSFWRVIIFGRYINPDEQLFQQAAAEIKAFKEQFPLVKKGLKRKPQHHYFNALCKETKTKKRTRQFWKDMNLEGDADPLNEPSAKRAKINLEDDISIDVWKGTRVARFEITHLFVQKLLEKEVEKVGTTNPVADFRKMCANKEEDMVPEGSLRVVVSSANYKGRFCTAVKQMTTVIEKLVNTSFRDSHYAKAIECVVALREICAKV